jgi:TP901 family phage tail tape measure protein
MASGTSIGKLLVELGLEDSQFRGGLKGATAALEGMQKQGEAFAGSLDGVVKGALAAAGAAMAAFGVATLKVGIDFQQSLQTTAAVAGAVGPQFKQLENKARELGIATQYTAKEVSDAMYWFASAGYKVNDIMNATGPALYLAAGGATTLANSAELTAATLAQFGMDATQANKVSDVFTRTLQKSLFNIDSLKEAMKYAGTVGAGFGYTLEQTTAAVAQFRNLGLEGSMAGTSFRMAMSAAAHVTDSARKTLEKYGITQEQINPELHSFADIMTTIGKSAMTTSDAIDVFGQRSGANVVAIARQFADGSTQFHELLGELENSAGNAEKLYTTMTDTVQGRINIATSSFQELMLSLFDQMKGPLSSLITEISDTLNYVASVFNRQAGTIGASFSDTVQQVVEYLRNNRAEIALTFVGFVNGVRDAMVFLGKLLPVLTSLAKYMLVIWVADKVRVFVMAVQAAYTGLMAMTGGVEAVMTALTAATGGLYAVVAAVGTLVAGIAYLTLSSNAAADAADRLREAESKLAAEADARAAAAKKQADAIAGTQATTLAGFELELQARGQLSNTIEQQLEHLQRLDSGTVQAGLASGDLFTTTLNGTQVVLDHTTALQLQYDATLGADEASTGYRAAMASASQAVANTQVELGIFNDQMAKYEQVTKAGGASSKDAQILLGRFGSTMEEVQARGQQLTATLAEQRKKLDGLTNGMDLATKTLSKHEMATLNASEAEGRMGDAAEGAGDKAKAAAEEWKRAYEARLKAVERVEDAIGKRQATSTDKLRNEMQAQLETINEAFDAEVKAYGKQRARIAAAERERARVVAEIHADATAQAVADQTKAVDDIAAATLAAGRTAAEQEAFVQQQALQKRRDDLEATFQQELVLYEKGSVDRLFVLEHYFKAAAQLEALEAAESAKRQREAQAKVDAQVLTLRTQDAQAAANELQAIEADRQASLLEAVGATQEQVAAINALYDGRVLAQKRKLTDEVVMLVAGEGRKVLQLERERDAMLARLGDDQTDERQQVIDYYTQAIDDANAEAADSTDEAGAKMAAALDVVKQAALNVAKAIASGIGDAAQGVIGLFADMTGFSFDLFDAVDSVKGAMGDTADLAAQLAAGDISPTEYTAQMAALPSSLATAAEQYVTELVQGASQMLSAFVEAAPALVQALGAQLPALIDQFAAALPAVTQGLVDSIGPLIEALVQAVPQVAQALADSIGVVIDALVAGLPGLVSSLLDAIVQLLPTLGGIIAQLVDIVPWLVQSVLQALPTIIQSLVGALGTIIMALVDAVIMLVQVVIQQLPTIIQALVQGVLQLVQVLLAAIPQLIIGIVQQLPALIRAVLDAVTLLVQELVAQLPTIINALLVAVTDIIVAVAEMLPSLLTSIIEMLPSLIMAIVQLIPSLIKGVVSAIPYIITALINSIPVIIKALFTELLPAIFTSIPEIIGGLFKAIFYEIPMAIGELMAQLGTALWKLIDEGIDAVGKFFRDVIAEIVSLGADETATFGDTPGAVRAGAGGLSARFAPGDYVVAAQNPAVLLQQALDAMQGQFASALGPAGRGYSVGQADVPAAAGLAQAMLQAASAITASAQGTGGLGGTQQVQVTVQANGRTLDEALWEAGQRGQTPRLTRDLRQTTLRAGVHVGFTRGKFSP